MIRKVIDEIRDYLRGINSLKGHTTILSFEEHDVTQSCIEALQKIDSVVVLVRAVSATQAGYNDHLTQVDVTTEISCSELVETNRSSPEAMTSLQVAEEIIKALNSDQVCFFDLKSEFTQEGILTYTLTLQYKTNLEK